MKIDLTGRRADLTSGQTKKFWKKIRNLELHQRQENQIKKFYRPNYNKKYLSFFVLSEERWKGELDSQQKLRCLSPLSSRKSKSTLPTSLYKSELSPQPTHFTIVTKRMKEAAAITERAGALPITILNHIWGTKHGTIILKPSLDWSSKSL